MLALITIYSPNGSRIRAKIDRIHVSQLFVGDIVSFSYVQQFPQISRVRCDLNWENVLATFNMDAQCQLMLNSM
jgi:hypothetical protein